LGGPKACDAGVLHQYARRTEMRELILDEMERVNGGSLAADLGKALGTLFGAGAATQKSIDNSGNEMLSALQYGA
jgi:hypothetical protein